MDKLRRSSRPTVSWRLRPTGWPSETSPPEVYPTCSAARWTTCGFMDKQSRPPKSRKCTIPIPSATESPIGGVSSTLGRDRPPIRVSCATCDFDGTGQNNLFKYIAGLDPTNPSSAFWAQHCHGLDQLQRERWPARAYYPFDGNLTTDAYGNGHNGTAVGGVTLTNDRFGNTNSALNGDGVSGYIRVPTQLTTGNPFTWSVWFRPGFTATNVTVNTAQPGRQPGTRPGFPLSLGEFYQPSDFPSGNH